MIIKGTKNKTIKTKTLKASSGKLCLKKEKKNRMKSFKLNFVYLKRRGESITLSQSFLFLFK